MPRLMVLGNYTAKSWFKKAAGPFNVTIFDVTASGAAALSRDVDGDLMASESEMDMQFKDGSVDFKNLGRIWMVSKPPSDNRATAFLFKFLSRTITLKQPRASALKIIFWDPRFWQRKLTKIKKPNFFKRQFDGCFTLVRT